MIVIVNGPINSGKTTLGKELNNKLSNSLFVDVDYILGDRTYFEKNKNDFNNSFAEYCYQRLLKMIEVGNKLYETVDYLIFAYCIFPNTYNLIEKGWHGKEFMVFTLDPGEEVCKSNRGNRLLLEREYKKIEECYEKGVHNLPQSKLFLQSENLKENIEKVIASLNN